MFKAPPHDPRPKFRAWRRAMLIRLLTLIVISLAALYLLFQALVGRYLLINW